MARLNDIWHFVNKLLIVLVASLLLSSCSNTTELNETEPVSEVDNLVVENLCYNSTVVNLPDMSMVIDTQYLEGAYYVFTKVYAKDYSDYHNELIEIKDGAIQNTTVFDINFIAAKMCDQNTVAMISGGNAIIYDLNTSTVTNQSVIDGFTPNYYSSILALSDDGFVVAFDGNVGLCHISNVSDYLVRDLNAFFELGKPYDFLLIGDNGNGQYNLSFKLIHPKFLKRHKDVIPTPSGFKNIKNDLERRLKKI